MRTDEIAAQVARNCLIADARSYGHHSLCGLLMRLRELWKRERDLDPWARVETPEILPWVGEREAEWERLENADLAPVVIDGRAYDPFDEGGIDAAVAPLGLAYAAGQGPGGVKPLFVLGELEGRREESGVPVAVLGRELVHDLTPTPGMFREGRILLRREPMRFLLWATLEDAAVRREPGPADDALAAGGLDLRAVAADPAAHAGALAALARRELDTALFHELGEMAESRRRGPRWEALHLAAAGTKAGILVRALRDALADAGDGGTLARLVGLRRRASLGLFAAGDPGLRRRALPEARRIWEAARDGAWSEADAVRVAAARRLEALVARVEETLAGAANRAERARRADEVERLVLEPAAAAGQGATAP